MNPLIINGLFTAANSLIERFFPDPEKKAAAQLELLKMQQNGDLVRLAAETDLAKLQIQTNIEEAKHASLFIAGWRPFVGWTCGVAFAYAYVILPLLQFLAFTFGDAVMVKQLALLPALELEGMLPVLFGMLGLGAMRSVEKIKDAEGNR